MEEFRLSQIILFHGSNVIVEKPQILQNGFYKDFGYGFYTSDCILYRRRIENIKF